MNVLHINSYYFNGEFYKNFYDKQTHLGIGIDVYVPANKNNQKLERSDYGDYTQISYNFNNLDRVSFVLKHKKILADMVKFYNIKRYDLIHAHSLFSNGYIAYKLNEIYGVPYIVAIRNTDVNLFFKKMVHLRKLGRQIINNAKAVIFISPSYRELVISKYITESQRNDVENKSYVIPNGIDDFWLKNINESRRFNANDNIIKIISAGDISNNKNQLLTLEMCKSLIGMGYDVTFDIAGNIINEKIYNELISNKFVNYLGKLNRNQLLTAYRNNDVFVMPSKKETFGLVYAEAMTQGLPLLYTKGQGFDKQFKEGEVGYSVSCDDKADLTAKMLKIIENYLKFSEQCKKKANSFNWEKIAKQYINVYEKSIDIKK